MTDLQIQNIIEQEFTDKTFGTTEQYLEIHSPIYQAGSVVIERIDRENENQVVVYLPVEGESFYFAVYLDEKDCKFLGITTEPRYRIYFRATSESKTHTELAELTTLASTGGWSKGDINKNSNRQMTFSAFEIHPNPEPDEFEDKLDKLLTYLEQDKEGIKSFANTADAYIMAAMNIHNPNGMIGGPILSKEAILRMASLGLSISFDMYLEGKGFL